MRRSCTPSTSTSTVTHNYNARSRTELNRNCPQSSLDNNNNTGIMIREQLDNDNVINVGGNRKVLCEKGFKALRIILIIAFSGIIISYVTGKVYSNFREELDSLKQQISHMTKNSIPDSKIAESKSSSSCLEIIRSYVQQELEYFNADKTGKTDFALESSGGNIVSTRDTELFRGAKSISIFGFSLCPGSNNPRALIQASVMPGECWAFQGSKGTAVIKLINRISVTGITLEHISRSISPTGDAATAPKEFSIWGLQSLDDKDAFFFGQFRYDIEGSALQYFPVKQLSARTFELIEFRVHSNHGHPKHTCVYRLRVHGDLDKYNVK